MKMSQAEKDLYYACANFCSSFFHLMCAKEDYNNRRLFKFSDDMDPYERDAKRMLEFEEERLKNAFDRLCDAIDKIKPESKM